MNGIMKAQLQRVASYRNLTLVSTFPGWFILQLRNCQAKLLQEGILRTVNIYVNYMKLIIKIIQGFSRLFNNRKAENQRNRAANHLCISAAVALCLQAAILQMAGAEQFFLLALRTNNIHEL